MSAKPVQISMDEELLRRIDAHPQARKEGRSALIRSAVALYLRAKERQDVDLAIARAYEGEDEEMLEEVQQIMSKQAWPRK